MAKTKRQSLNPFSNVEALLIRRDVATRSLLDSLAHLSREAQYNILLSWFDLDDVEELAMMQKRRTDEMRGR